MAAAPPLLRARPAVLAYLATSALWFAVAGLPTERLFILAWLFGLLALSIMGEGRARLAGLVRDWGAFALLLLAYRYSAGLADSFGRPVTVEPLAALDRAIGLGEVPTIRLQRWLGLDGEARVPWWHVPLSLVYLSHFFAVLVAAAWLWRRDRPAWLAYATRLLTLGVCAVVTYVLVPAAPPWMAAADGVVDGSVARTSLDGLGYLGVGLADPIVEQGRAVANPVAALPSMHAGFAAFLCAFFWSRCGARGRALLGLYALAMAFTLVATGEHWVVDVVLGWAYVAAVMAAWSRADARRSGRVRRAATVAPWPALDPTLPSASSPGSS
jgi:hypothetical protein